MQLKQALEKSSVALIIIGVLGILTLAVLAACYYWTMDLLEVSTKNLIDSSIATPKITVPQPDSDKDVPVFIPQNFDGAKMDFYHEKDLDGDGVKEIFGILHGPNIEQTNLVPIYFVFYEPAPTTNAQIKDYLKLGEISDFLLGDMTSIAAVQVSDDLNHDGVKEILATMRAEGSGAYLIYCIYDYKNPEAPYLLQGDLAKGGVEVSQDEVTTSEAIYYPDEPTCCPTRTQTRTYAWNDAEQAMIMTSENIETIEIEY